MYPYRRRSSFKKMLRKHLSDRIALALRTRAVAVNVCIARKLVPGAHDVRRTLCPFQIDMSDSATSLSDSMCSMSVSTSPPLLGPGEVLKPSGKFSKPTRIPGKKYCKDEVVIRNADSGKGESSQSRPSRNTDSIGVCSKIDFCIYSNGYQRKACSYDRRT